jgi:hypothetical protein
MRGARARKDGEPTQPASVRSFRFRARVRLVGEHFSRAASGRCSIALRCWPSRRFANEPKLLLMCGLTSGTSPPS